MARKKKHEEHENHERWLISYADFITLLFAFFVVMYSISSVNQGKYRVLSESLVASFKAPQRSLSPIQVGQPAKTTQSLTKIVRRTQATVRPIITPHAVPVLGGDDEKGRDGKMAGGEQIGHGESFGKGEGEGEKEGKGLATINQVAEEIKQAMAHLIDQGLVSMVQKDEWIEVEINNSVLFTSGSAQLQKNAVPLLEEMARILRDFPSTMKVEGFTDNVPINTLIYPSNWELSAARASSVVRLFEKNEIAPERMMAIGYGEHRPIGDNSSIEGRAMNRRVVLVVMADTEIEKKLSERINEANEAGAGLSFSRKIDNRVNVSDDDNTEVLLNEGSGKEPMEATEIRDKSILPLEEASKGQKAVSDEKVIPAPLIPLLEKIDGIKVPLDKLQSDADTIKQDKGKLENAAEQFIVNKEAEISPELPPLTLPEEEQSRKIELPIILPSQLFFPPIKFTLATPASTVLNTNGSQVSNIEVNDDLIHPQPETVDAVSPVFQSDTIINEVENHVVIPAVITEEPINGRNEELMNKQAVEVRQEMPVFIPELQPADTGSNNEFSMRSPATGFSGPLFLPPIRFSPPLSVPQMRINNDRSVRQGEQK